MVKHSPKILLSQKKKKKKKPPLLHESRFTSKCVVVQKTDTSHLGVRSGPLVELVHLRQYTLLVPATSDTLLLFVWFPENDAVCKK